MLIIDVFKLKVHFWQYRKSKSTNDLRNQATMIRSSEGEWLEERKGRGYDVIIL